LLGVVINGTSLLDGALDGSKVVAKKTSGRQVCAPSRPEKSTHVANTMSAANLATSVPEPIAMPMLRRRKIVASWLDAMIGRDDDTKYALSLLESWCVIYTVSSLPMCAKQSRPD
jgi:hypothetical protein